MRSLTALGCVAVLSFAAGAARAAGPIQSELDNAARDGDNWLYADRDYRGTRYSPLDQINSRTAPALGQNCSYSFPEKQPAQTAPLAYGGVLYATTAHYTTALDGGTCKVLWEHKWDPKGKETFATQRGAAIKDGKVIRGTGDGYLIALDAQNGQLLWAREIAKPSDGYYISMPPLIYDDLILIGPGGAELAAKGWVGAFRLADGAPVWKFNTVANPGEPGAETWRGDPNALKHGGGTLWTAMAFDADKGLLYVPVGNPAPDFYDKNRPGKNLYTDALVALDVRTGELAWYYQAVPHDVRDYDLTHVAPVFTMQLRGAPHTLIGLTGKDGLLRVVDRDTRKVLYSVPFTTRENAEGPIGTSFKHVCPGALGGHEWSGAAYSPRLSALFVPATDWCEQLKQSDKPPDPAAVAKGVLYMGGEMQFDPWDRAKGWLTAFDAATGKQRWRYSSAKPMIGGAVATGGDLIIVGEITGDLVVLDALTGEALYRHHLNGPIGGGVISYAVGGRQHIAAVSGFVGGYYNQMAPDIGGQNPTVSVFALKE